MDSDCEGQERMSRSRADLVSELAEEEGRHDEQRGAESHWKWTGQSFSLFFFQFIPVLQSSLFNFLRR